MRRLFVATVGLVILVAQPTLAHHSMTAFDLNERVTLQGVLEEDDWRNPHVSLLMEVKSEAGSLNAWTLQGPAPSFFRERKIQRTDIEDSLGKSITVEASRAHDGSMTGLIRQITLANGKVVSACPQYC